MSSALPFRAALHWPPLLALHGSDSSAAPAVDLHDLADSIQRVYRAIDEEIGE